MRGSLFRSAYELFYTAVAPGDKRAVKSLIDVGADRAGDAVGSAGVSLMLVVSPGRHGPMLALACSMSIIALLLAMRLRRGYLKALETSLVERAIELDPSMVEDSATRSVLMRSVEMRIRVSQIVRGLALQWRRRPPQAMRSFAGRPTFVPMTSRAPSAPPASLARTIGRSRPL